MLSIDNKMYSILFFSYFPPKYHLHSYIDLLRSNIKAEVQGNCLITKTYVMNITDLKEKPLNFRNVKRTTLKFIIT